MPIRTSYPQGTPNWLELHTDDHTAAKTFYGELFGWRFDAPTTATSDPCHRAYLGDALVAAVCPSVTAGPPAASADRAVSPAWISYLAVDDIDEVVRTVNDAGGRVTIPPHDRADRGRAALVADPTGATVGLWQPYRQPGAALTGEAATAAWFELLTDDPTAASAFYRRVAGLASHTADLDGIKWTTLHVGDEAVAGIVGKRVTGSPNRWNAYFATDDVIETTRRAADLGATITADPTATSIGSMAGLRDPAGAHFSLWTPTRPK